MRKRFEGLFLPVAASTLVLLSVGTTCYKLGARNQEETDKDCYESDPEIKNCPASDVCSWFEEDLTTGGCIQNCGFEVPVTWTAGEPRCPTGYTAVVGQETLPDKSVISPVEHCVIEEARQTAK